MTGDQVGILAIISIIVPALLLAAYFTYDQKKIYERKGKKNKPDRA